MEEKSAEAIEAELADLKGRWPAHSVPPHMWQQLEDLEEQLKAAKRRRKEREEGIFDTSHGHKLDREERVRELQPDRLAREVAGMQAGMTAVDFGSGSGTFALPLAELAGESGKVYAVDNSAEMQALLRAKNPPPQLVPVAAEVMQTGLDGGIADICLLAFILHEVQEPEQLAAEAARLLRPGGQAVVLEWRAEKYKPGPPRDVRISKERLAELLQEAGLQMESYAGWSDNAYTAVGRKPA